MDAKTLSWHPQGTEKINGKLEFYSQQRYFSRMKVKYKNMETKKNLKQF